MLDLALGLALLFFGLAVFCSFIQERVCSVFGLRQRNLYRALQGMLERAPDPLEKNPSFLPRVFSDIGGTLISLFRKRPQGAVDVLLQIPTIKALRGKGWAGTNLRLAPSHLPRDVFVDAVKRLAPEMSIGLSEDAYKLLNTLHDDELGDWFDVTMERSRGWFRRQSQVFLIVIASVVVVGFNVDALHIGNVLLKNSALRETLALEAQRVSAAGQSSGVVMSSMKTLLEESGDELGLGERCKDKTGISGLVTCAFESVTTNLVDAPKHAAGWLITIVAASAGAPFWFDVLSRLTALRSGTAPPSPTTGARTEKRRAKKEEEPGAAKDDEGSDSDG